MSKQDRQGARTVTDLERKYNLGSFGEQFAEVFGIATDARKATIELEERLTSEIKAVRNEIKEGAEGLLLRSEFDTFQGTVTAELALKVSKDDNSQIISMIEAYADEIRLQSNTLVIDSDFFELTRNGVATITSAQIDYANIDYATMLNAHIGSAYFSDNGTYITPQIYFLSDGIYLPEHANRASNRDCFVWRNSDGTDIFRLRGYSDGFHLEGVSYEDTNLDMVVFGISIRELYNKVNELSGHEHTYTTTSTATCTSAGKITYTCACGHSYSEDAPATGHNYSEGYCTVCGAADPDYNLDLYVNYGSNGVTVSWNAVENADYYYVAVLNEDMDYIESKDTEYTSINMGVFSSIGSGTYKVKVRAHSNYYGELKEGITTVTVSSVG